MTEAIENNSSAWRATGEFKIVHDKKRTVKKSCSGQMIEALKRAKAPLSLNALATRVRLTKAGKQLKVKDVKARVRDCAEWYYKDKNGWVDKTEAGEYFLVRLPVA